MREPMGRPPIEPTRKIQFDIGRRTSSGTPSGNYLTTGDVDDTPVDGELTDAISSNWAYGHDNDDDVHDATAVNVSELGTATYDDVQDFIDQTGPRGTISGMGLTGDDVNGNVDVAAGTGWIKITNSANATSVSFDYAGTTDVAVSADVVTYIYYDYNGGTPQIVTDTTGALFYDYDHIILGCVFRHGTHVHCFNSTLSAVDTAHRLKMHFFEDEEYHRTSGLVTSSTGTRNLAITAGVIWAGFTRQTSLSFDTSASDSGTADATEAYKLHDADGGFSANDVGKVVKNTTDSTYTYVADYVDSGELTLDDDIFVSGENYSIYDAFEYWYNTDGGSTWTQTKYATQISNTQYNKQTSPFGLQSLTVNKYGVHWVYSDAEGENIFVVYGQGDYSANEAEEAAVPATLPPLATGFGILIAKIICQQGTDTMTISYPWTSVFTSSLATDHGSLGGLGDDDHTIYVLADGTRAMAELTLTPKSSSASSAEGTIYYDSDDNHIYVATE